MSQQEAIEVFTLFKSKEGAQHIAKPVTLEYVISFCKENNPQRILEIGSGIGTISYAALKYSNATLDMFEGNDWCVDQLRINLSQFKDRFTIEKSMNAKPRFDAYDLIIVDGGAGAKGDFGNQSAIVSLLRKLRSIDNIYYEGDRKEQQQATFSYLKDYYTFNCTLHKPKIFKGKSWIGGRSYILKKSSSTITKTLSYAHWQVRHNSRLFFRLRRKLKYLIYKK